MLKKVFYTLCISFVVLWSCFPLYWAFITSLQTSSEMLQVSLWPSKPTLVHYCSIIYKTGFLKCVLNSFYVAGITILFANLLGVPAAFALARFMFPGVKVLQAMIWIISFLPPIVLLGGLLDVVRFLGLYDSKAGLIFSYMLIVLPFTVWSLRNYMMQIPRELEEAAIMDGVSVWRMFWKVFIPLSAPAIITTGLIAFITAWNEFLLALTMILSDKNRTATVGITLISGTTEFEIPWGQIMAAAGIVTIPLICLVLFFQKRIVSGVTVGAVKG
ncbi:MAG: carbohydrate ABC transporter permease [Alphaproteobacteria bacterium]|nr:carbohydrate ABC transporter permease [Alphaproteobacteria bacterium]